MPDVPTVSVHLTDPRTMRALAHPTRLRLLGERPELRVAGELLQRTILRRWFQKLETYLELQATFDTAWVRAAAGSDSILYLTVEELGELRDELEALAKRWQEKSDSQREDVAQVTLLFHAFRSEP